MIEGNANDCYILDKANLKQKQSMQFSESLTKLGKKN